MSHTVKVVSVVGIALAGLFLGVEQSYAIDGGASLTLTNQDPEYGVLDPEDHTKPADPGDIAATTGPLRIDYAPSFTFVDAKLSKNTMRSKAEAQLLHNGSGPRANFIQISDYRNTGTGWSLLVRQENQFRDEANGNASLKGASLSFDKAWSYSSLGQSFAPTVSKETVVMNNIGDTYPLAKAEAGKGMGTWSISFGASKTNPLEQENTLTPLLDSNNQPVKDSTFENQDKYQNDAIQLTIPASSAINAGNYSTVLTWIIAELP